jgi:hypothetical protein
MSTRSIPNALLFCVFILTACGSDENTKQRVSERAENHGLDGDDGIQNCQNIAVAPILRVVDQNVSKLHRLIEKNSAPLDWNTVDETLFCSSLSFVNSNVTVGVTQTTSDGEYINYADNINHLKDQLSQIFPSPITYLSSDSILGTIKLRLNDCNFLPDLRELPTVEFVELAFSRGIELLVTNNEHVLNRSSDESCKDIPLVDALNPGLYDINDTQVPYDQYMNLIDMDAANRMRNHNMDKVYNRYQTLGTANIGISVLDNGILPEQVDYLSAGNGSFTLEGYFSPSNQSGVDIDFDGVHPTSSDFYHLSQYIFPVYSHGTRQSKQVFYMAPHSDRMSVRAANFVFLLESFQVDGVTRSIVKMADNPDIQIVSMSMGSIFHSHEMSRAIDYFNSKGKLLFTAAGTSIKGVRDLVGVIFPANLESTISVTGIKKEKTSNGDFILGANSHGGRQNDFVIDYSNSSSEAVSTLAGMTAVIWSLNPALSRDEIGDLLRSSSTFYSESGEKHPVFGWGKIDMLLAAEQAMNTL